MSLEENPVFNIYDRLMPSAWSGVTQMKVYARARCFFAPGVDDVEIVKLIQKEIRPSVFGQVGPAQCRGAIICKTDIRTPEFSQAIDDAMTWWHALFCAARRLAAVDDAVKTVWPNLRLRLTGDPCCDVCAVLDGVVFRRDSPALIPFMPPWHIGCGLHFENVKKATRPTESRIDTDALLKMANVRRMFSPCEFAAEWLLNEDVSLPSMFEIIGCLLRRMMPPKKN
jgi:hypothetical protein